VAVQRGPKGTFVYTVGPDQKAAVKPVEVQDMEGDVALISRGIEEGDKVVVDGQSQLRPGALTVVKGPEGGGEKKRAPKP